MSVIFKILNCYTVYKELCQCQGTEKSAGTWKKHWKKKPYLPKNLELDRSLTFTFRLWTTEPFFFPITKPNDDIVQLFLCKPVYQLILLKGEMLKNHMQVLGLYPYEEKGSAKEKWGRGYFFNLIFAHNKHIS